MNDIAKLNDRFRMALGLPALCGGIPGQTVVTAGIAALPFDTQAQILARVRTFDAFTADNDPYGERDFGAFDMQGVGKVFWKIDYYDPAYAFGSEDPADIEATARVLTIMLASEY
jgi:hypothetical protein